VGDLDGGAVLCALQVNSAKASILSINKENTLEPENINHIMLKSVLYI